MCSSCDPPAATVSGQVRRGTGGCAAALVALVACTAVPPRSPRVLAATIAPLADLLGRVAGEGWEIRTVVPPGTSPHVFEPLPRDVRRVGEARLLFAVGAGYDAWAVRLVTAAAGTAEVFDGAAALGIAGTGREEDEGRIGTDPHWWLSPVLARRAVEPLAARLAALDPAGAPGYRNRGAALADALGRLDAETERLLAPFAGRGFVSSHAGWAYFAERYRLRAVGAIEPVPGREPSPRTLLALITTARREGLRTLFTEPQFPPGAAAVVAGEAHLALSILDPIGGVPGREGYEAMIRFNAARLAAGLGTGG